MTAKGVNPHFLEKTAATAVLAALAVVKVAQAAVVRVVQAAVVRVALGAVVAANNLKQKKYKYNLSIFFYPLKRIID